MLLKGLQKLTLLDFPGRMAATVFTGGCNLRCPFCHNASLVLRAGDAEKIDELFSVLANAIANYDDSLRNTTLVNVPSFYNGGNKANPKRFN